jgi:transcriptional regulator with XRE-family HTH domain
MSKGLGLLLKGWREEKRWSQYQLASKSGIPRTTISAVELGTRTPKLGALTKLAKALNKPLADLYAAAGYEVPGAEVPRHTETPEEILERLKLAQPVSVPVYREFHAPPQGEPIDFIYRARAKDAGKNIEAFIVRGHCLAPIVEDNDVVVVDRDLLPNPGDIVLCLMPDNVLVVGKYKIKNDIAWLENTAQSIKLVDCAASAVVVEVIKRLR